jgi:hypothetical protein
MERCQNKNKKIIEQRKEILENHRTDNGSSWNNLGQNENHGTALGNIENHGTDPGQPWNKFRGKRKS